jgi:hypothetical protein
MLNFLTFRRRGIGDTHGKKLRLQRQTAAD